MSKVGLGCAAAGALAAVIGAVVGVLLIQDKNFVVATLRCNLDDPESFGNTTNCVSNKLVDPVSQKVCQVGNLGLFTADYTPECTAGQVGYDLTSSPPPLNANFSTKTQEFGLLFPAQTNFQGILEQVNPDLEFTSCDEYFASAAVAQAVGGVGVGTLLSGYGTLGSGLQASLVNGIENTLRGGADTAFGAMCGIIYGAISPSIIAASEFVASATFPTDISLPYGGEPTLAQFLLAVPTLTAFAGIDPDLPGLATLFANTISAATVTGPQAAWVQVCNTGYSGTPAGIPVTGWYTAMGSATLCAFLGKPSSCSFADFVLNLPNAPASILPLRDLLEGFELGINADPRLENISLAPPYSGTFDTSNLESTVANVIADTASSVESALYILALEKNVFYQNLYRDFVSINAQTNTADLLPDSFTSFAVLKLQQYAFICQGLSLPNTCSLFDIVNATFVNVIPGLIAGANNALELFQAQSQARGIGLILGSMAACLQVPPPTGPITNRVACSASAAALPISSGATLTDIAAAILFGNFYGFDEGQTYAQYATAAIESCKDDEKDIAAILQAQTLVPAGVALGFVGAAGAAIASALVLTGRGGSVGKHLTLVAGIVTAVGVVLVIVALLGILNAPIYRSVGAGSGPVEDNSQLRSQGPGAILAYVTLGAGLAGTVCILISAVVLYVGGKDASESNILAKA